MYYFFIIHKKDAGQWSVARFQKSGQKSGREPKVKCQGSKVRVRVRVRVRVTG